MVETSGLWPNGNILEGCPSLMGDSHGTLGCWGCCLALAPPFSENSLPVYAVTTRGRPTCPTEAGAQAEGFQAGRA